MSMPQKLQEVILKIEKLKRLSSSQNVNEAANAMAMAAKLMAQYQLREADISLPGQEEELKVSVFNIYESKTRIEWQEHIAMGLGEMFSCKVFASGNGMKLFGSTNDSNTVVYIFKLILNEIEFYCTEMWNCYGKLIKEDGKSFQSRSWKNSFRLGCGIAIAQRLRAMKPELMRETGVRALVVYDQKKSLIDKWISSLQWRQLPVINKITNQNGYNVGKEAGKRVNIGDQAEGEIKQTHQLEDHSS